jgi:hypothetical protein
MTLNEARTQHVANILAGGSGLVYFCLKYVAKSQDPYSSAGNPWEPFAHNTHVLLSPLLLFAVGLIWADHVWLKIARGRQGRRESGVMITVLFPPMAISAYLIQVSVDETWRKVWVVIHLATSALWIAGYATHLITRPVLQPAQRPTQQPARRSAARK